MARECSACATLSPGISTHTIGREIVGSPEDNAYCKAGHYLSIVLLWPLLEPCVCKPGFHFEKNNSMESCMLKGKCHYRVIT